jgi:CDP-glucose 4,6-dehydratase
MPTSRSDNDLLKFERPLAGRHVLITGHTGFTGGWLALWLRAIGADVTGLALEPCTEPNLFTSARIEDSLTSRIGDIRDPELVGTVVEEAQPFVVFHLAAQPLVSRSFADPLETFTTNVAGTANVLEAARLAASVKAVICITTDKVYADQGAQRGHTETDRLGGKDPYSASKAGAEIVAASYRATLAARANGMLVATARGGNIIGGGDWSDDRIVPDFVRAVTCRTPLVLRNPAAVRPWQHVLALVHGYLLLAGKLAQGDVACADAWNFGSSDKDAVSVEMLVDGLARAWTRPEVQRVSGSFPETQFLRLDSAKAHAGLGWRTPLDFTAAVELTATWYRDFIADPRSARASTMRQIEDYRKQLQVLT